jgi:hypothetical protein
VYPGIGLVQLLSDGLDPTTFSDEKYYQALLLSPHNVGRTSFIEQRKLGPATPAVQAARDGNPPILECAKSSN